MVMANQCRDAIEGELERIFKIGLIPDRVWSVLRKDPSFIRFARRNSQDGFLACAMMARGAMVYMRSLGEKKTRKPYRKRSAEARYHRMMEFVLREFFETGYSLLGNPQEAAQALVDDPYHSEWMRSLRDKWNIAHPDDAVHRDDTFRKALNRARSALGDVAGYMKTLCSKDECIRSLVESFRHTLMVKHIAPWLVHDSIHVARAELTGEYPFPILDADQARLVLCALNKQDVLLGEEVPTVPDDWEEISLFLAERANDADATKEKIAANLSDLAEDDETSYRKTISVLKPTHPTDGDCHRWMLEVLEERFSRLSSTPLRLALRTRPMWSALQSGSSPRDT